jgi:hypothetical protein
VEKYPEDGGRGSGASHSVCPHLGDGPRVRRRCFGSSPIVAPRSRASRVASPGFHAGNTDFGSSSCSSEPGGSSWRFAASRPVRLRAGSALSRALASAIVLGVRLPREAALFRQRGMHGALLRQGLRRLVTWRFGACFGLELHPVGCFFVSRRSSSQWCSHRSVSVSAGAADSRVSSKGLHVVRIALSGAARS